jgi:hypothetical protein
MLERGKVCVQEVFDTITELLDRVSQDGAPEAGSHQRGHNIRDTVDSLKSRIQELKDICKTFADPDNHSTKVPDCILVAKRDVLRNELEMKNAQLEKLINSSRKLLVLINVTTPL